MTFGRSANMAAVRRRGTVLPCSLLAVAVVSSWQSQFSTFVGQALWPRTSSSTATARAAAADWKERLQEAKAEDSRKPQAPVTGGGFGKGKKAKKKISLEEALERQRALVDADDKTKREEAKLTPEKTFYEGPPAATELLLPFLACFAVIGIIPFIAAVNRQFRIKYIITDRRISVEGGWDGSDVTEFSYQEIKQIKYGLRYFGYCADVRIDLRDGAQVEVFGLADFEDNYNYIWKRVEPDCRKISDAPP